MTLVCVCVRVCVCVCVCVCARVCLCVPAQLECDAGTCSCVLPPLPPRKLFAHGKALWDARLAAFNALLRSSCAERRVAGSATMMSFLGADRTIVERCGACVNVCICVCVPTRARARPEHSIASKGGAPASLWLPLPLDL